MPCRQGLAQHDARGVPPARPGAAARPRVQPRRVRPAGRRRRAVRPVPGAADPGVRGRPLRPRAERDALDRVRAAVEDGEAAAAAARWPDVGTADIRFHRAVAALVGSPRVDEMIRHLMAEMRLVFHEMGSPREFHEPYLARNRRMYDLLAAADYDAAERELRSYLDDAEAQLMKAYRDKD
ncbi:FCD domain-containing protein [Actinomadura sp. CNU-125]|uniref:FCD domain-containing protein n=1 Tax=Actinomadura sp. CNU-125 TaxID=1904961 RepID=UPI00291601DE|nr:FCD domain-containing protein [Actinomadura sp. CNU-125]